VKLVMMRVFEVDSKRWMEGFLAPRSTMMMADVLMMMMMCYLK